MYERDLVIVRRIYIVWRLFWVFFNMINRQILPCVAKTCVVKHHAQAVQPNVFKIAMLVVPLTFDISIPLSLALTLGWGYKMNAKQTSWLKQFKLNIPILLFT